MTVHRDITWPPTGKSQWPLTTAKKLESEGSAQALRTRRAIADMLWCRAEAHIKIFESYWQGRDPRRLLNARHGLAVLGECEATGGQERQAK